MFRLSATYFVYKFGRDIDQNDHFGYVCTMGAQARCRVGFFLGTNVNTPFFQVLTQVRAQRTSLGL